MSGTTRSLWAVVLLVKHSYTVLSILASGFYHWHFSSNIGRSPFNLIVAVTVCEESWVLKNWCFWTVVLEKTLESPLDCKEIKPINPEGNQSWLFIGGTDGEAEAPILWPPDAKNWLILMLRKTEGRRGRGSQDEMVGWHHWLNGHDFEHAPGVGDGQGSLACYSPWGHRESATNEQLNWRKYATGKDAIHLKYTKHVFRCYSKNNNNNTKRR